MKLAKFMFVALLVVPFAAQLNAQTLSGAVAGSSALWVEAGQGAAAANGGCVWTQNKGGGQPIVTDSRVGLTENGNTWVVWSTGGGTCAAPGAAAQVWLYINLDSTLGVRCLFANPACTWSTTAAAGDPGHSPDKLGINDTPLPAGVLAAINGASINVAGTDITPTDAKFATYEALGPCGPLSAGTQYQGWGYGPGPVGAAISSQAGSSFHVVDFNIVGNDPITAAPVLGGNGFTITPVGATPVVVFVNTANAAGFGAAGVTNATRLGLALAYSQISVRTADFIPQLGGGAGPFFGITAWSREPLSGTYTTFNRSISDNKEIYRGQETGNCGANGTYTVLTNPLLQSRTVGGTTGNHERAIGTGEMVSQVVATQDALGYAFWSAGNFAGTNFGAGAANTIKYLTVDGVDPIQNAYTTGQVPTSGNGLLGGVTLANVASGAYPIWSELRFVSSTPNAGIAQQLSAWAQAFSTTPGGAQPDFITANNLNVFHEHFNLPFIADNVANDGPRVCGPAAPAEQGGDAGGLVLTLQAGSDYAILKGNYNAAGCVGPTNTASWGSHQ